MKKKIFLTAIVISIFAIFSKSCNNVPKGDGSVTVTEVDNNTFIVCHIKNVKDTITINLSDLAKDFKIVRFENTDDALFKYSTPPTISDKYISIRQSKSPLLLFNHNGKLVCEVGSVGGGPGEYNLLYDEVINDKIGKIYLAPFFNSAKILEYTTDGRFVRDIVVKNKLNKPKIDVSDNGDITVIHMPFVSDIDQFFALSYDNDGNLKNELKPSGGLMVQNTDQYGNNTGFSNEIFSYRNTSDFDFMITSCDTLFYYNKQENKVYPKFTVDFGGMENVPLHIYNEIPDYYLVYVAGSGVIAVNKKKHTSNYIKIVNDFFGHMNAPKFNFNKGWFYQMHEPSQLMEKIEARIAQSDCTSEDRKKLEEVLKSLDENDNNLLFIAKIK